MCWKLMMFRFQLVVGVTRIIHDRSLWHAWIVCTCVGDPNPTCDQMGSPSPFIFCTLVCHLSYQNLGESHPVPTQVLPNRQSHWGAWPATALSQQTTAICDDLYLLYIFSRARIASKITLPPNIEKISDPIAATSVWEWAASTDTCWGCRLTQQQDIPWESKVMWYTTTSLPRCCSLTWTIMQRATKRICS